jgi:hypothetical protein
MLPSPRFPEGVRTGLGSVRSEKSNSLVRVGSALVRFVLEKAVAPFTPGPFWVRFVLAKMPPGGTRSDAAPRRQARACELAPRTRAFLIALERPEPRGVLGMAED